MTPAPEMPVRPRRRSDCAGGARPCPWVGCRYHLALEVLPGGRLERQRGPLERLACTCALDVADRGRQLDVATVGALLGVGEKRAAGILWRALRRVRRHLEATR